MTLHTLRTSLGTAASKRLGVTIAGATLLLGCGALTWQHNQATPAPHSGRAVQQVAPAGSGRPAAGAAAVAPVLTTVVLVRSQAAATTVQTELNAAADLFAQGVATAPIIAVVVAETDAQATFVRGTLDQAALDGPATGLPGVTILDLRTP